MADKYLVVVDMQKDFVTGSLGTKEAEAVVSRVTEKVKNFDGIVVFTQDTHFEDYLETQEGRMLPVKHCIKATDGWRLIPQLESLAEEKQCRIFEKNTFGSVELADFLRQRYAENELESVELIGLCTDICVVSNALLIKAYMPELTVKVDAGCCAGVTPDKHDAAIQVMESCQIVVE